jgi:hypothetical protein
MTDLTTSNGPANHPKTSYRQTPEAAAGTNQMLRTELKTKGNPGLLFVRAPAFGAEHVKTRGKPLWPGQASLGKAFTCAAARPAHACNSSAVRVALAACSGVRSAFGAMPPRFSALSWRAAASMRPSTERMGRSESAARGRQSVAHGGCCHAVPVQGGAAADHGQVRSGARRRYSHIPRRVPCTRTFPGTQWRWDWRRHRCKRGGVMMDGMMSGMHRGMGMIGLPCACGAQA